ncbi:MAG: oxidoreductase [Chloroflexi bacterium 13_1_40CM_4_68_4]|nr:MAG: oxidoreductase [Chloroflexi bacterium 13_1_40CM_4_68_4]
MGGRLRAGLVSAAHVHAEAYATLLLSMPDVELVGLADIDAARGRAFAEVHHIRFLGTLDALLGERPDAVVVTSENTRHRSDVEASARAGAHVLCEKPLATTAADAAAIVDSCRAAGVRLMTAFPMRFSAPVRSVAASLRAGEVGEVRAVAAVNQGALPARERSWFAEAALSGGGAVMDHTVHVVDLLRWMLDREPVEVWATTNRILHAARAAVETGGLVLVTFEGGAFASIDCSWSRPDTYPTWGGLGMEIVGTRGVLDLDAFRQRFVVHDSHEAHATWTYWGSDPDRAMLRAFVDAIRAGEEPPVSGVDGLRAVEVVEAAYRSAASGQPVRLAAVRA